VQCDGPYGCVTYRVSAWGQKIEPKSKPLENTDFTLASSVNLRRRLEASMRYTATLEFLFSGAGKHPDFQVTSCHHFDTTNVDFAYIKSE
jgi:hypothetical protein